MNGIENVMAENMQPINRTSIDDCGKCAFYNLADVCRAVACTDSNNVMSNFWVVKDSGFKDVFESIRRESAERVRIVSRAILDKRNGR